MTLQVDKLDLFEALERTDFNLQLTAERLGASVEDLLAQLTTEDEIVLLSKMRIRASIDMYRLWKNNMAFYIRALAEASPGETIRGFANVTNALANIFDKGRTTINNNNSVNLNNLLLQSLQPDERKQVIALLSQPESDDQSGNQSPGSTC